MRRVLMVSCAAAVMAARGLAAGDALDTRVTIAFSNAAAADVITQLASAAGVKAEIGAGAMRPVTITLTNVRLMTALNAVCENALCTWRLSGALKVTPLPSEASAALPARLSFQLSEVPPAEVFRAIGTAIGAPVTIEPSLPNDPVTLNFKDAPTPEVLNILCNMLQCSWDFDAQRGLRVVQKR
jgi:type II secretory pathway component GspD/PulD (secretin)